jgi:hypothetical protein
LQAARHGSARIKWLMKIVGKPLGFSTNKIAIYFATVCTFSAGSLRAQDQGPGPIAPVPDHDVRRIVGIAQPEAPPSLPPAQIIKTFSQKEDEYLSARPQYSYRKTIRIQEFGSNGAPTGEYIATYEAIRSSDGKIYEKAVSAPRTSLEELNFEPEDVQALFRIPPYPVTATQLSKYNVQFLGDEKVDEVDCYIFQVNPKTLERQHGYFDGVIWVDKKYLEVVKTYGKWVTDLGDMHPATLPFSIFETYRENVDGKYWFPNYSRSEEVIHLKDRNVPIRVTIKWTDFKPFAATPATPTPAAPAASPTPASSAPPTQAQPKP